MFDEELLSSLILRFILSGGGRSLELLPGIIVESLKQSLSKTFFWKLYLKLFIRNAVPSLDSLFCKFFFCYLLNTLSFISLISFSFLAL